MKTFVIYDRKTGEILQTHVQPDEPHGGPEHLLKSVRPESSTEAVEVLAVEELVPGTHYKVDVKTKKLTQVAENKVKGAGGAFVQSTDADPSRARTIVVPIEPPKKM